jgi:hypothetical protein
MRIKIILFISVALVSIISLNNIFDDLLIGYENFA